MTPQIRVDDRAKRRLEEITDEIDGTQSGIASEFIRRQADKWLEEERNGDEADGGAADDGETDRNDFLEKLEGE